MKSYRIFVIIAAALAVVLGVSASVFAQESQNAPAQPEMAQPAQAPADQKEISIYGEIRNVNAAANTISVQYYDYDADDEKTADIIADQGTKIENTASLADIKKGDWADVTYATADGKNMAKLIRVEKEEEPVDEGDMEPTLEEKAKKQ